MTPKRFLYVLGAFAALQNPSLSDAGEVPFFYPAKPIPSSMNPVPNWIKEGQSDDLYLRVSARVDMDDSCIRLGTPGVMGIFFKKKAQISVALVLSGIETPFGSKTIPLMTIDGRQNPGGCHLASRDEVNIVPFTLLRPASPASTDRINAKIQVRYDVDTEINFVESANSVLGIASIFTTGGAINTLSTFSTALATPALTKAQDSVESVLKLSLPLEKAWYSDWKDFRALGIQNVQVPIFSGTANDKNEVQKMATAAGDTSPSATNRPAFVVSLNFSYLKSVFDTQMSDVTLKPSSDALQPRRILSYPDVAGAPSILQLLNSDTDANLIQAFATANSQFTWRAACNAAEVILSKMGLNALDRGIALKAFIDYSRLKANNKWYDEKDFEFCFESNQRMRTLVKMAYDKDVVFVHPDIWANPIANNDAKAKWDAQNPLLQELYRALTSSSDRATSISSIAKDLGDKFILQNSNTALWDLENPTPPAIEGAPLPSNIARLTTKRLVAGCIMPTPPGFAPRRAMMIVITEAQTPWVLFPIIDDTAPPLLRGVEIRPLGELPGMTKFYRESEKSGGFQADSVCSTKIKTALSW